MPKLPRKLTPLSLCLILMLPLSGCVNAPNTNAICYGTAQSRTNHAAALAKDGGPDSLVTGAILIQQIDAGCRK